MCKNLVIAGAGDFGREVAALVNRINQQSQEERYNILGFVDDNNIIQGKIIDNIPVLGKVDWLNDYKEELYVVCSVGTGYIRKKIISKIENPNIKFPKLVDPNVTFLGSANLGEGVIVCANNAVSINSTVGNHTIVNLSCTLGHDVMIGEYCTINPGCNLSGFVELGDCVDVGTGTKIIQHVKIGKNTVIGAGTVVVKDVEADVTVVGCPAKIIKYHNR